MRIEGLLKPCAVAILGASELPSLGRGLVPSVALIVTQ
jgi:hypothetical protein